MNIRDLTIWPTLQPTALAASSAVRVVCGISTTRQVNPKALRASCTFWALELKFCAILTFLFPVDTG
jgi:hypothetical protein